MKAYEKHISKKIKFKNLYVSINNGGDICTSLDKSKWTFRDHDHDILIIRPNRILALTCKKRKSGDCYYLKESVDGINWNWVKFGPIYNGGQYSEVIYFRNQFIAITEEGGYYGIASSPDGFDWTHRGV